MLIFLFAMICICDARQKKKFRTGFDKMAGFRACEFSICDVTLI